MKRTNEEFRAEVFRRKEVYLKARKKRIFGAVLGMPLYFAVAFTALSLAIAMHPAGGLGGAAPGGNAGGDIGGKYEEIKGHSITESDARYEHICAFLEGVWARGAEEEEFEWDLKADFTHKFFLGAGGKPYYVNKDYIFDGEDTFFITDEEYVQFLDIINYDGGKYYEK